jgi:MFS family permease
MVATVPRRVALFLAGIQFFFALTWVVYVIYLPQLAAQAGLGKGAVLALLMLDQLIFLAIDFAMGVAADRATRQFRRLGPAIAGVTLFSCAAFLLLPWAAPQGAGWLMAVTVLWSASSSVLRAPPLTLIGRHAAKPSQPALVAWSMLGLGLAAAAAPYLGTVLAGVDARVPFVASSLALAAATFGIVAAERALERARSGGLPQAPEGAATMPVPRAPFGLSFLGAAVLVALAFQAHVFLNSAPLYRQHAPADELPWLMPVFWVGFNLALWPVGVLAKRHGGWPVMTVSAGLAALAAVLAPHAPDLQALVSAQLVAGAAWGGVLVSAFSTALALGHTGREGRWSGAVSSVLAGAALARIGFLAAHGPVDGAAAWLAWAPVLCWLAGAALLALRWKQRGGAVQAPAAA